VTTLTLAVFFDKVLVTVSRKMWHLRMHFNLMHFNFNLPAELRSISDSTVFKNKLKTYLFNMAFNIQ